MMVKALVCSAEVVLLRLGRRWTALTTVGGRPLRPCWVAMHVRVRCSLLMTRDYGCCTAAVASRAKSRPPAECSLLEL